VKDVSWIKELTLGGVLQRQAHERGDKIFLDYLPDRKTWTFLQVRESSNRIANSLLDLGVHKGAHVASVLLNSPEQVLFYFALGTIGAISIPLNPDARGEQLIYYLNHSNSTVVCVSDTLLKTLLAVMPQTTVKKVIVVREGGAALPRADIELIDFDSLLTSDSKAPSVEVAFSDLAEIRFTSGTTGPSKGNIFNHAANLHFAMGVMERLSVSDKDIYYVCFPLHHASGWNAAILPMLQVGGGVALTRRFSASAYLDEAGRSSATLFNLLSVGDFLLSRPPSSSDRDHKLRVGLAAPMPARAEEFERRFGAALVGAFGLSDFSCAFALAPGERTNKRLSVGRPFDYIEAKLVDDDDFEVPIDVPGELLLRHKLPWLSASGYYQMPEATIEARRDLWMRTGDRMYRDKDNFFYFVDRKKDSIRRRGENISSYELENTLIRHRAIAEAVALGLRAATGEDDVAVALVRTPDGEVTEEEIAEYCSEKLPNYMVPRYVLFVDSLPRTITGKIEKYKVKEHMTAHRSDLWDRETAATAHKTRGEPF
jgi:carnitine-CoA ligase